MACRLFAATGTCTHGEDCRFSHSTNENGGRGHPHEDALGRFFSQYPAFGYRQQASSTKEFYRMCDFFRWRDKSPEKEHARDCFRDALVEQFNSLYGMDVEDIESWRRLCNAIGITPLPEDLKAARKIVSNIHVNLVDLVDTRRTGCEVKVFASLKKLQNYTISTGKFFPKENAYAGGVLKYLLRQILG